MSRLSSSKSSITPGTSNITNASNSAISADTTNYSTFNVPLNVLGTTTAYQSLIFSTLAPANTPVVLKVGGVSSTLAVSGQIVIQAYNNNTPVNPAISGSSLNSSGNLWVRFLPQGVYNNI